MQSERLWTQGWAGAGEAFSPNQKSAGMGSCSPLASSMSMISQELFSGKAAHTTAAIDETTAVDTEVPVSLAVYPEARGHRATAFAA